MANWVIFASFLLLLVGTGCRAYLFDTALNSLFHPYSTSSPLHQFSGDHCTQLHGYRELKNLLEHDTCLSVNKVFSTVYSIHGGSFEIHCRQSIVAKFADKFPRGTNTPSNCTCTGVNELHTYGTHETHTYGTSSHNGGFHTDTSPNTGSSYTGSRYEQCHTDQHYMNLYDMFYRRQGHSGRAPGCRTHHTVWYDLSHIGSSSHCQFDLLKHLSATFNNYDDPCTCHAAPTTSKTTTTTTPTTTTTTTTTTTAATTTSTTTAPTTTSTTPTTTTAIAMSFVCNKLGVVLAIGANAVVSSEYANMCSGWGSGEGFVLAECNVTSVNLWRKGLQVRPNCDRIPWYTPIAVFTPHSTTYNPTGAVSGIFIGCLDNGFKMVVKYCDQSEGPFIVHLEDGGVLSMDPLNYYTIY